MTFHRDLAGNIIPAGRVSKRLYEPFMPGGALPSWLAAQAGTVTYDLASSSTAASGAKLTTAATNGAGARLWSTFDIYPAMHEEIIFTLYGLRFGNTDGYDVWFQLSQTGNDRGVSFMHNNATGDDGAFIRAHNSGGVNTDHTTGYNLKKSNGGSGKPRNVTMRWRPKRQEVALFEDDQMMGNASIVGESLTTSGIRPMVTLTAREAVAHSFTFAAAELILVHN